MLRIFVFWEFMQYYSVLCNKIDGKWERFDLKIKSFKGEDQMQECAVELHSILISQNSTGFDRNPYLFAFLFRWEENEGLFPVALAYESEVRKDGKIQPAICIESCFTEKIYKELNPKVLYALLRREIAAQSPSVKEKYNLAYL